MVLFQWMIALQQFFPILEPEIPGEGNEGSNGGHVDLHTENQHIDGDMVVDSVSSLNFYVSDDSSYTGAINSAGADGQVYVELEDGAKWTLTADSYITSLTCGEDAIDLNGHKLVVGDKEYTEGTASTGEAIVVEIQSSGQGGPDGKGGQPPQGGKSGNGQGMQPPQGNPPEGAPEGNPPEMPAESAAAQ